MRFAHDDNALSSPWTLKLEGLSREAEILCAQVQVVYEQQAWNRLFRACLFPASQKPEVPGVQRCRFLPIHDLADMSPYKTK